eukprot:gnl/Dysnectes_brevis/4427_a5946_665.p2 GENE.gnl/Dysnectes_brevis/4427_a5946_665~~gnl/Dysnectes_brevis/4427_a5946_665.p2  ORF type:complete len:190 (+),score=2.44 gnl/Dysnectes_brevis/4427_a5946_665:74-643(+)
MKKRPEYTCELVSQIVEDVYISNSESAPSCSRCQALAVSPRKTECGELLCFTCASKHDICHQCEQKCSLCPISDFQRNLLTKFFCTCPHRGCTVVTSIIGMEFHLEHCTHAGVDPQPSQLVTDVYLHSPKEDEPVCASCSCLAISPKQTRCGEFLCLQCHSTRSRTNSPTLTPAHGSKTYSRFFIHNMT